MLFEKRDGLFLGRFGPLLDSGWLVHGISTRKGGVSGAPYDSLNLGLNTDDGEDRVRENRRRFFESVGLDETGLVTPRQVHGDTVRAVDAPGTVPDADAVVTDRRGIILSIQVADCLPVYLIDPVKKAVGLVHAGWRGTGKNIAGKTVMVMNKAFGTNASDLLAFFGPSIGPCCCAVEEDASARFDPSYVRDGRLDLWRCNEDQLLEAGVKSGNVVQSRLCTACHPEWFFSHRASGGKTGRMLAVLAWNKSLDI